MEAKFKAGLAKARNRDSLHAVRKLLRRRGRPPDQQRSATHRAGRGDLCDLGAGRRRDGVRRPARVVQAQAAGRPATPAGPVHLLPIGLKVVGVGSVGTRAWILLSTGRRGRPVVPAGQGGSEVGARRLRRSASGTRNQGERVVAGQRLMQVTSDIFLGWQRATAAWTASSGLLHPTTAGLEGIRGRREHGPAMMAFYGRLCGWTLARAHARSGDRIAIAAYLGKSDEFDNAVADFPRPTPIRTSSTTPPWPRPSPRDASRRVSGL